MRDLLTTMERAAPRDLPLVVDARGAVDVETLFARVDRAARHLAGHRRVAVLAPSSSAFLVATFGAWRAGATVVVLSPLHPPAETTYFCDHARVDALVVHPSLVDRAAHLREGRRALTTDDLDAPPPSIDPTPASIDDDALVLYTSGTTARPKGARITHRNLAQHSMLLRDAWRWSPSDRLVHALPLHHLHGLGIALFTALSAGAGVELLEKFDAPRVWETIAVASEGNASREPVLMGVPTSLGRMVSALDEADAPTRRRWTAAARTLRLTTSGSAALATKLSDRWRAISGDAPLERFGMTEIGVGTCARIDRPKIPGVAGWALPSVELRVVDESGRVVAVAGAASAIACSEGRRGEEDGELHVKGPSVFPGYDFDDEATRAAFTPEGWFKTGDSVSIDDTGAMRVRGRLSVDVLKSGGYKISALEVEEALRAHPDVIDVAVVGVPDEEWGERVTAAIVARAGATLDLERLRAFCKERLAAYKVPRGLELFDALPRNVVGKVTKPAIVARLTAARAKRS